MKLAITAILTFSFAILSAQNKVGINTTNPEYVLDIHSASDTDAPNLQLMTPSGNHFLRFFAGHNDDANPFILFSNTDTFRIAHSTSNYADFTESLTILPTGQMGIRNINPEAKLDILGGDWNLDAGNPGDLRIGDSLYNFRVGVATGGGGAGTVRLYSQGGDLLLGANNSPHLVVDVSGGVGVNTFDPLADLHISGLSGAGHPQLRLTELEDDYARIKFESTAFPNSYWDVAARGGNDTSGVKRFNLFFYNGTSGRDLLLLQGSGDMWRNSFEDHVYDYYFTNNVYQGGLGFSATEMRMFTKFNSDKNISIGTREGRDLVIDTAGNIGIGADTIAARVHIANNSSIEHPQLRLTETEDDYARVKFESTEFPNSFWDVAARGGTDSSGVRRFNIYYQQEGIGTDIMSLSPSGVLNYNTRNSFFATNYYTNYDHQGQLYFDNDEMWIRTISTSNNKIHLGTKSRRDLTIDTLGNIGLGVLDPQFRLDIHSSGEDEAANLQLATPGGNHFLRAFAGRDGDPKPFLLFNNSDTFRIASSTFEYGNFTEHLTITPNGRVDLSEGSLIVDNTSTRVKNSLFVNNFGGMGAQPVIILRDYYTGNADGLNINLESGDANIINRTAGKELSFGTNNTVKARLESSGDLHLITGDLYVDNGRMYVTSQEYFENGGDFVLRLNGALTSTYDNLDDLGSASYRWNDIYATNGTIQTSDIRDKTDINVLDYGLESVMSMQPVSFKWKDKPEQGDKLGLIAQDLLEVIPEVVKTKDWVRNENGEPEEVELDRLGVYYSDLIPVLINAIQEQQAMISDLQQQVTELQNTIDND